jgi:hypothetical protein
MGMAMTFTIASAATEALTDILLDRMRRHNEEEERRVKEYEEVRTQIRIEGDLTVSDGSQENKRYTCDTGNISEVEKGIFSRTYSEKRERGG